MHDLALKILKTRNGRILGFVKLAHGGNEKVRSDRVSLSKFNVLAPT
jgi:hypothetical protein